ncbi:MAG: RHS repeat-associated core domain-containing protein [Nitrospira sp.]|nr:RHS repeat-associated core domain-containing protein [Nitrospira sp.]
MCQRCVDPCRLTYKQGATTLGDLTYTYDSDGNRIKVEGSFARTNLPPALATTTYNANNQQTTFGTSTETFDLNGNLATVTDAGGTTTYTWNARNQLASISGPSLTASFTYDSFGRRTGKTINGTTTNFVYDMLNPVQEKDGGTVTANLLTGLSIDEFFTGTDSVGVRALLPDALGSTVALGDGTGTLQTHYTYEPFGVTTQTGAASTNSYKFTGREDDGTGLYYYRARYYQPSLQRFIAEDPIGFLGGDVNLYGYVDNNPLLLRDPMGLLTLGQGTLLGCGLGAGGGAIGTKKPRQTVIGAGVGGALGCTFGTLIAVPGNLPLPPTPAWVAVGALTGGIAGGLTAAAKGGTPLQIAVGALGGAAGGAIGNLVPLGPVGGALVGVGVSGFLDLIGP